LSILLYALKFENSELIKTLDDVFQEDQHTDITVAIFISYLNQINSIRFS